MKSRKLRVVIASIVVAAGVATAGVVAATTATADPITSGARAQIATKSVNGVRYCIIPTGELRQCDFSSTPRNRYIFQAVNCGSGQSGKCYRIRLVWSPGQCLYYDTFTAGSAKIHKIGYRTCESDNLRHRWLIEELDSGWVQLRPASHTSRCVVHDPSALPSKPPSDNRIIGSTSVDKCSSHPQSHTRFKLR